MRLRLTIPFAILIAASASAQSMEDCPMHAEHMKNAEHSAKVDHRHTMAAVDVATTHHSFRLFENGAAIELHANAADDAATIAKIRTHMKMIAEEFASNDFSTPMFIHDKMPDGVATMKKLHADIAYRYEELPDGARVVISTSDAQALAAVHAFMRFQIAEHRSGDSGQVEKGEAGRP